MEPFIGQIILFGGHFAPRGYAFCHGQLLTISDHSALFSILGTTYGGNGTSNFGLPDLRGRVPMQQGSGPGLTPVDLGQRGGKETTTLGVDQMPRHSHLVRAGRNGDLGVATNNFLAAMPRNTTGRYIASSSTSMNPEMLENTGGNQPFDNHQPYLALNYCIALVGIYPSRS